jgi:hypothetical protein
MANTLTNLIPDLYTSLDVVSREQTGLIPSVTSDMTFERAAVGQQVRSPVAPAVSASDITPAVTPPNDGDQTIGNVAMTISKSRRVPIRYNGEETRGLANNGANKSQIIVNQFAQAMRTLTNEVEADLAALYAGASRAYGTAGTTPFGTAGDFQDASNVLKILKDNGAPMSDLSLVLDTTAGAKLIGLQSRYDVAGDTQMQQQGIILNKAGFAIRESAQILTPTAGTGASYQINNSGGYAVGATTLAVDTGSGTILAGDVVTIGSHKYVVATALSGGSFTIAAPGLRATVADNASVTVVAAAARSMAFSRNAIALATRAPALPDEGDSADDRTIVTDPRSGLSFEVSMYKQYRQVQYEVALAWGVKVIKAEHLALLLG